MPQDVLITVLVLFSAFLHAVWNALVKTRADRVLTLGLLSTFSIAFGLTMLPFVPAPPPQARVYLALGVLTHLLFKIFLLQAYRAGDLSHVYPLARGSAPLMVAVMSIFIGEPLHSGEILGVAAISLGIIILTFEYGLPRQHQRASVGFALLTGLAIACYTVVDGLGVRAYGHTLGYAVYLFLVDGTIFFSGVMALRWRNLPQTPLSAVLISFTGGLFAMGGYVIVVWALSLGAMAGVAALRETGVIFAALIGTFILKEPLGTRRIFASLCVAAGVVLISLG